MGTKKLRATVTIEYEVQEDWYIKPELMLPTEHNALVDQPELLLEKIIDMDAEEFSKCLTVEEVKE